MIFSKDSQNAKEYHIFPKKNKQTFFKQKQQQCICNIYILTTLLILNNRAQVIWLAFLVIAQILIISQSSEALNKLILQQKYQNRS